MTCVTAPDDPHARDRAIDRVVLSRRFGIPLMLLLLAIVFWLTLSGANTVSAMLSGFLLGLEAPLRRVLTALSLPPGAVSLLTDGVWRVLATVVSVMLPPMAIFSRSSPCSRTPAICRASRFSWIMRSAAPAPAASRA